MSPSTGEMTIGMTILSSTPPQSTVDSAASDAPTMPPNSACDDEDGRPFHQVSRFHAVAPIRADPPSGTVGLLIVGSALIGATAWNLLTWWKGLPSSSSHALFGGMGGAALAAGAPVLWNGVLTKIVVPMVLSPVVGLILGYFVMTIILWLFRGQHPGRTSRGFRYAQTFSAAAMALGHGLQDAGKTMGIIVLALTVGGYQHDSSIPNWVKISTALVISAGTYSGGWRIMRTLGRKIIHLDPPQGFAAEASGATILY